MFGKVFGANVDWISQHSVLPEYFRQQFYATGNLFPEFAANIGGGQNIYNFSYYGLYSPLILPSYFLPFVKMSDYIMAVSIFCLVADLLLFYKWLRGNEISKGNACLTSVLFLLAGPMIFHSYNQVMFVDYMPFLILGLLGVDRYFKGKKCGLFMHVLYQPYGIGLTTLVITVLLTGLTYCTWREKYIHIACILVMTIPLFLYVLNGGLYLRGKVLIPMLPLLCYLIGI